MNSLMQALDTELIRLFQSGNQSALEVLINRYKDKIYSSIFFLVKDKQLSEDLFQDVFIKIIDFINNNRYNEEGKFIHWALRIAHNLCVDYFRKTKRTKIINTSQEEVFEAFTSTAESADGFITKGQTNAKIHKMIEQLPEEQREVIVLRHFADMSFKEIAETTNTSVNTALGRMRYALINLRKMMTENQLAL
ncbi:MAG: sigma-70 family RNA polymerase sigma factor [Bacteroidetes bacterium]|nr:sigma-70 family RNA polymerase sigma factor [Bacteroidota bacterium]MBS1592328.1 sigma-70 family RNA polymerase sigma factor [Bacteroidota bacterium]MBS1639729.1 sigma-70 family RNA polymerase sigma factor [Bacteroidota bacterium]